MRVKALQEMYYDKRMRAVGEEYEMDDREEATAKLLEILGKIEIAKKEILGQIEKYRTAAMTPAEPEPPSAPAEPMTTENTEALGTEPKRYRRRDMRAEK
jgi:hypothetical protein